MAERVAYVNHAWRVDHNLNERNRVFASAALYNRDSEYGNYFGNAATGEQFYFTARRGAIDYVNVPAADAVFNLRYAYNRFVRSADLNPESRGFDLRTLAPGNPAWAAWNDSIDPELRRFPLIDIGGYFNVVGTSGSGVLDRPQDTHSFAGSANYARGRHMIQLGAEYRVYRKGERNPYPAWMNGAAAGSSTGWLRFREDWTKGPTDTSAAPPIGAGLASFLLGLPSLGGGIAQRASFAEQSTVTAAHFQDTWKILDRLTLTLGLRYEVEGPLTERFDRSVRGFNPSAALPIAQAVQANFARIAASVPERSGDRFEIRGGVNFANRNGEPRALYARDANNIMPRVAAAFSLNPTTVLRAGYGMFFGPMGVRRGDVFQTGFSQTTPLVPSKDDGLSFIATLENPFPNGATAPAGASLGAMAGIGDQISYLNTAYLAPYLQRWQISVQKQIGPHIAVEIAYVGNSSAKLETTRNVNGIPLQFLSRSPVRDQARIDYLSRNEIDNPFYGVLPLTTPLGSSTKISRAALLAPYPQFTRVETTTNEGASRYHSVQAKLDKRFSHGHTVGATYTGSKLMEAVGYLNEADIAPYWTVSGLDYSHRVALSWIYELPLGRGRWLSGWQLDGLYVYQIGAPLAFDNLGFYGDIKDIPLPGGERNPSRWFNTLAGFERDSTRALAYNVRTFPLRLSGVRGPGMNNWDLSLLKNTTVGGDRVRVQLRGDFLNAMNRPWFANPNMNPASTLFGVITAEQGYMRRVQLGLKVSF